MKNLYIQYLLRLATFLLIGQINYCSQHHLAEKSCGEHADRLDRSITIEESCNKPQEVQAHHDAMSK